MKNFETFWKYLKGVGLIFLSHEIQTNGQLKSKVDMWYFSLMVYMCVTYVRTVNGQLEGISDKLWT